MKYMGIILKFESCKAIVVEFNNKHAELKVSILNCFAVCLYVATIH